MMRADTSGDHVEGKVTSPAPGDVLAVSATPKTREEGRKERKVRREAQAKRQAEELKEVAAAERKKARRERQKQTAGAQPSLPVTGPRGHAGVADNVADEVKPKVSGKASEPKAVATPGKNQRKKERRRLAAEAAAPSSSSSASESSLSTATAASVAPTAVEVETAAAVETSSLHEAEDGKVRTKTIRVRKEEGAEKIAAKPVQQADETAEMKWERENWMTQKAALQAKFGEQPWNPRKRISPDALAGIRTLHAQQPNMYSTEVLSNHFKVSADAIRRILKSKWQPSEEASEDRRKRWEKRGEKKWKEMVELGIRPPKKWRDMGVGKVSKGETPTWKKGGARGGERWIEHVETDSFVMAGDMASESADAKIGDRII